jgi:RNA methyltransferase, TrmH family
MLVEKITSRQNPLVKRFRRVRSGGEHHHVFIEGVRLIEDALKAGAHFESVAFTAVLEANERGLALLDLLQSVRCRGAQVSKSVMEAIADTENPQGVAAIVSRPYFELDDILARDPQILLVADQLQDPGNLGTIIRTAEAAGASCLVTTRYTVDPFNLKALRASMGSALRLPVVTDAALTDVVTRCRERKIKLIASRPQSIRPQGMIEDAALMETVRAHTDADLTVPFALILGREASGISTGTASEADESVYIPMAEGVESLNVASAAAILLYEAARQRKFRFDKKPSP